MATIRDIAKRAGVSISTVSYVINGTKKVKPQTKARVMEAIKELNYQPKEVARSLKTGRTLTLGIIIPDISNVFFTEVVKGIEDEANRFGYSVILCNTDNDEKRESKYLNTLINKDIDGLIYVGIGRNSRISENNVNIPVVIVDRKLGNYYSSVTVNNRKGGYMAVKHLLSKRKEDVLYLTGPLYISTFFDRLTGYQEAIKSEGLEFNELMIQECNYDYEGGMSGIESILQKGIIPKLIFASNDLMAIGAMRALKNHGILVPDDVLIVGYDDTSVASVVMPALTTIRQPKYEMGQKAVGVILKKLKDKTYPNEHLILDPELIIRETTIQPKLAELVRG